MERGSRKLSAHRVQRYSLWAPSSPDNTVSSMPQADIAESKTDPRRARSDSGRPPPLSHRSSMRSGSTADPRHTHSIAMIGPACSRYRPRYCLKPDSSRAPAEPKDRTSSPDVEAFRLSRLVVEEHFQLVFPRGPAVGFAMWNLVRSLFTGGSIRSRAARPDRARVSTFRAPEPLQRGRLR